MAILPAAAAATGAVPKPESAGAIRVMLVDDSAVVRGLITRMLEAEPDIRVIASVGNGQLAVNGLERAAPDVVVLDIEMPVMDGLTALPKLLAIDPTVKVIMASTLTLRNAEISIQALNAGAADYVPKPSASKELGGTGDFRRELVEKVRNLGGAHQRVRKPLVPRAVSSGAARPFGASAQPVEISLRPLGSKAPELLAIGSSTGGPQALLSFIKDLGPVPHLPVFITQHMPATFTAVLANHIAKATGLACEEARDGEPVTAGKIYLAAGGFHLLVEGDRTKRVIRLNDGPPENFCRPSVDPMLRSLVRAYDGHVLTVILTGMGSDGLEGGRAVVNAGGTVIAQDEKSCVVWGMPRAVAEAGLCSAVLPLPKIAATVQKILGPGR